MVWCWLLYREKMRTKRDQQMSIERAGARTALTVWRKIFRMKSSTKSKRAGMWEETEMCARRDNTMEALRKRLLGWLFHVHESSIHPSSWLIQRHRCSSISLLLLLSFLAGASPLWEACPLFSSVSVAHTLFSRISIFIQTSWGREEKQKQGCFISVSCRLQPISGELVSSQLSGYSQWHLSQTTHPHSCALMQIDLCTQSHGNKQFILICTLLHY